MCILLQRISKPHDFVKYISEKMNLWRKELITQKLLLRGNIKKLLSRAHVCSLKQRSTDAHDQNEQTLLWVFRGRLADLFFFIHSSRICNSHFKFFVLVCFAQLFRIFISFLFKPQFRFSDIIPPGFSHIGLTQVKPWCQNIGQTYANTMLWSSMYIQFSKAAKWPDSIIQG